MLFCIVVLADFINPFQKGEIMVVLDMSEIASISEHAQEYASAFLDSS
jgi:hypothetical protein